MKYSFRCLRYWALIPEWLHQQVTFGDPWQGPSHPSRLVAGQWPWENTEKPCLVHAFIYDLQVDYSSKQNCAKTLLSLSQNNSVFLARTMVMLDAGINKDFWSILFPLPGVMDILWIFFNQSNHCIFSQLVFCHISKQ